MGARQLKEGSGEPGQTTSSSRTSTWVKSLVLILAAFALSTVRGSNSLGDLIASERVASAVDWVSWQLTSLPTDPARRAQALLKRWPIIDGHIDLPILARGFFANQVAELDLEAPNGPVKGQVDIPRLRKGGVGGFFWSAYIMCPEDAGYPKDNDGNFTTPTWRVRDTLEQIDTARLLIDQHRDTFELVTSAKEWRKAVRKGKVAGMIGIEGGHQLGNSLSSLRTYFALGARYVTLTHTCHNAIGDSSGMQGTPIAPRWGGLSPFGKIALKEMNRIGMIADMSHTHPSTASDVLTLSEAPPIFSHSNARGVHAADRNVPDSILRRIGAMSKSRAPYRLSDDGEGGKGWGSDSGEAEKVIPSGDSIVMLNFAPQFISEGLEGSDRRANVTLLADHADYIGKLAGREHVGIGSDFDGILTVPVGLEDASAYPHLITELVARGWSDKEIAGVTSENLLRVLARVEVVAAKHAKLRTPPNTAVFEGRSDLHRRGW